MKKPDCFIETYTNGRVYKAQEKYYISKNTKPSDIESVDEYIEDTLESLTLHTIAIFKIYQTNKPLHQRLLERQIIPH